ncbi:Hypothetical protein LUCI_3037 [Lucifera butyrica]|uniref:Uncharacterized protein n=1 Tax=Lucifera butyrica TaxID=1351585 RepID=A0A498RBZ4_9FIRM|nr:hypothetical protein [Lucifera butyrica]VBB07772.1 Hypothetical protein LUCI_3037 [Lucifera butyrica]
MFKIYKSITENVLLVSHQENYIEDLNVHVIVYDKLMYITDLTNALKAEKVCKRYVIKMEDEFENGQFSDQFIKWLEDWSLEEFIKCLLAGAFRFYGICVTVRELKAVNVFSPFTTVESMRKGRLVDTITRYS